MPYQERWIAGETTASGDRECASRYEMLRPVLESYQRQFTVWDIGANLGYFGCRIAAEFGAVSIMVDPRPVLADVVRENALPTTIAMTHQLTAEDLIELAQSEHADVVLALNVLHHMPDWRKALPAVFALGENVIIETPGIGDVNSAHYRESQELFHALWRHTQETLGASESHVTAGIKRPMFLFHRPKTAVTSSYSYRERVRSRGAHAVRPHRIDSDQTEKTVLFADGECRRWHHGMNLWNWLQMGGSYPDRKDVQDTVALTRICDVHGDIKPWNFILQGQTVQIIDGGHRHNDDATGLEQTIAMIANPELAHAR